MRKNLLFLIVLIFISCKEKKLPNNISAALWDYEIQESINSKFDSIIINLDESKINKLAIDSLDVIISQEKFNRNILEEKENKLQELLKFNVEYSDYDEIKNRKIEPIADIGKNYDLILNRYYNLKNEKK